MNTHSL